MCIHFATYKWALYVCTLGRCAQDSLFRKSKSRPMSNDEGREMHYCFSMDCIARFPLESKLHYIKENESARHLSIQYIQRSVNKLYCEI